MAGAFFGVATLLKVFPWVVGGYFLFRRRWTVVASSLILTATFALWLLALYGIDRNLDLARGTWVSTTWLDRRRNISIIGNLHALLLAGAPAKSSATVYLRITFIVLLILSIVAISGIITWRAPHEPVTSSGLCWSLRIISSILLSPVAWDYYLVLLIPMCVLLAAQMTGRDNSRIHQMNCWSYLLGTALEIGGMLGFVLLPY